MHSIVKLTGVIKGSKWSLISMAGLPGNRRNSQFSCWNFCHGEKLHVTFTSSNCAHAVTAGKGGGGGGGRGCWLPVHGPLSSYSSSK